MIVSTPLRRSSATTASPTGPAPSTIASVRAMDSPFPQIWIIAIEGAIKA